MNNRQSGRRRGRGGQQARNGQPGGPDRGNRIDNRARGNATQLLEKYRNLARDAQMQGDRVNTEYYLQFADHYFRVLNETRARFEEQRPRNNDYRDDFGGDEDGADTGQPRYDGRDEQGGDDNWDDGDQPQAERREPRDYREAREPRDGREVREPRGNREPREPREPRPAYAQDGEGERRERAPLAVNGNGEGRRERGRRNGSVNGVNGHAPASDDSFAAPDFLNEQIAPRLDLDAGSTADQAQPASAEPAPEAVEEAPKRRRTRRPRGEAAPVEA